MATKDRITFYATEKIRGIVDKYVSELGINQSSFVSMCIAEYAKNDDMLQNMKTVQETIDNLKSLAEESKK